MDFHQTCINTLLGGGKRVDKILVTMTLFSRSQQHIGMSNFDKNSFPILDLLNRMIDSEQTLPVHVVSL